MDKRFYIYAGVLAVALGLGACGDDDSSVPTGKDAATTTGDAGDHATDAGDHQADSGGTEDAGEPECFEHPKTHDEIINACTDAEAIDKEPELPLLLPDGGLPPLP